MISNWIFTSQELGGDEDYSQEHFHHQNDSELSINDDVSHNDRFRLFFVFLIHLLIGGGGDGGGGEYIKSQNGVHQAQLLRSKAS